MTPLMIAIDNTSFDTARVLLDAGANPHVWDWYGRTALYVATDMSSFRGRQPHPTASSETSATDLVRLLLEAGVNPNAQLNMHRPSRGGNNGRFADELLNTGTTPLLRAAIGADVEAARLLLEHGALVDLPSVHGITPLMAAAGHTLDAASATAEQRTASASARDRAHRPVLGRRRRHQRQDHGRQQPHRERRAAAERRDGAQRTERAVRRREERLGATSSSICSRKARTRRSATRSAERPSTPRSAASPAATPSCPRTSPPDCAKHAASRSPLASAAVLLPRVASLPRCEYHAAAHDPGGSPMRTVYALVLCSLSGAALAQAPAAAPPDPFVGSAALGYLATSGNTEATNLNSSLKITWDLDGPWTHNWTALAIRASTDDVTTAEAYAAGYKATARFLGDELSILLRRLAPRRVLGLRPAGHRSRRLRPPAARHAASHARARRRRRCQAIGPDHGRGARRGDRARRRSTIC